MLEHLTIRNFQTHQKLVVDFDRHITIFVGESDVGKSSVLRALRWVCCNVPNGEAFIRHGSKFVRVSLTVDGKTIKRSRGQKNLYALDGQVFAAFGADVPDAIASLLNLGEVNFQGQHDAPYWLSESPGQVSRNLNHIINLGIIDKSLTHIGAEVRRSKTEVELTAARLKQAKQERRSLDWVSEFESRLVKLEKWAKSLELQRSTIADLASAITDVQTATQTVRRASPAIQSGQRAVAAGQKALKLKKRRDALQTLIQTIKRTKQSWQQASARAAALKAKLVGKKCPICGNPIQDV